MASVFFQLRLSLYKSLLVLCLLPKHRPWGHSLIHSAGPEGRFVCREETGEPLRILFGFSRAHEVLQCSKILFFFCPNWCEEDTSECLEIEASVIAEFWTFGNSFATSQFLVSVLDWHLAPDYSHAYLMVAANFVCSNFAVASAQPWVHHWLKLAHQREHDVKELQLVSHQLWKRSMTTGEDSHSVYFHSNSSFCRKKKKRSRRKITHINPEISITMLLLGRGSGIFWPCKSPVINRVSPLWHHFSRGKMSVVGAKHI